MKDVYFSTINNGEELTLTCDEMLNKYEKFRQAETKIDKDLYFKEHKKDDHYQEPYSSYLYDKVEIDADYNKMCHQKEINSIGDIEERIREKDELDARGKCCCPVIPPCPELPKHEFATFYNTGMQCIRSGEFIKFNQTLSHREIKLDPKDKSKINLGKSKYVMISYSISDRCSAACPQVQLVVNGKDYMAPVSSHNLDNFSVNLIYRLPERAVIQLRVVRGTIRLNEVCGINSYITILGIH